MLLPKKRKVNDDASQADDTHRQVDEERGTPTVVLAQEPSQGWTCSSADSICSRHNNLPTNPGMRIGKQVGYGRKGSAHHHACPNSLESAHHHQKLHGLRESAQHGSDRKRGNGRYAITKGFRPKKSPSLPNTGTVTTEARR